MEKIKAKAKKGTRCPMEGAPRKYIGDSVAVEVPNTAYYRRLVNPRDGSLIKVKAEKTVKKTGGNKK